MNSGREGVNCSVMVRCSALTLADVLRQLNRVLLDFAQGREWDSSCRVMIASGRLMSQAEKKANNPARPCWQLHATDDKPYGEATGECTDNAVVLSGNDIGSIRPTSSAPNTVPASRPENDVRHAEWSAEWCAHTTSSETEISHGRVLWQTYRTHFVMGPSGASSIG